MYIVFVIALAGAAAIGWQLGRLNGIATGRHLVMRDLREMRHMLQRDHAE
jgi:hypothetical protein